MNYSIDETNGAGETTHYELDEVNCSFWFPAIVLKATRLAQNIRSMSFSFEHQSKCGLDNQNKYQVTVSR